MHRELRFPHGIKYGFMKIFAAAPKLGLSLEQPAVITELTSMECDVKVTFGNGEGG
jgi:hypothetical protein